ncbi:hypothetical protein [Fibrella arboris]|uniref:hypothetical protein n=1 Tax=Fibrella arboris TaxID=3242486 RepID=UPI00351FCD1D
MEPEKDNWITNVLGSLDGLKRSEPSPFLFARIQTRLSVSASGAVVPRRLVWLAAASFAGLALLNWQLVTDRREPAQTGKSNLNVVITDMNLSPANNQLYDVWSGQNY